MFTDDEIDFYQDQSNYKDWSDDAYYDAYKKLKGKKSKEDFFIALQIFLDETLDSYVNGEGVPRDEAADNCIKRLKGGVWEFNRIFEAVDTVTAYT